MAYRRRPRTKVYDCNFNIGESYYKPVMDSLDRKYSGRPLDTVTPASERESTPLGRASRLAAELEANGVEPLSSKPSRASILRDDEDAEIDAEFEATMKRIKAARAARNKELEEEFDSYASKKKINLADHLLDSVGLNSKTQRAIEDEVIHKSKSSARKYLEDDEDKVLTKWSAIRPGARALQEAEEAADEMSAVARARQSRARILDIEADLEDMAARGAARQKRISDLKAFMDDTSSSSDNTVRVSKKITVKSSSEKKHVTF